MKKIVFIFSLFCLAQSALTQSSINNVYSRLGLGLLEPQGSINHFGMGGVSTINVEPNAVNLHNPASYSNLSRVVFQVSGRGNQSVMTNSESSARFRGGQVSEISLGLKKGGSKWGFAMGLTPYSNVGYSLTSAGSVNDSTDVAYKNDGSGGISKFTIGAARSFKLYHRLASDTTLRGTARYASDQRLKELNDSLELVRPKLSVGANLNYLFGSLRNVRKVEYSNTRFFGTRATSRTSINDIMLEAGVHYIMPLHLKWDQRKIKSGTFLLAGIDYQAGTSLNAKYDDLGEMYIYTNGQDAVVDTSYQIISQSGSFQLPQRMSFGLGLLKIGDEGLQMQYGIEYRMQDWSTFGGTFDNALGVESLGKYTSISAGIEVTPKSGESADNIFERAIYRVGARSANTYITIDGTNIKQQAVSAGLSIPMIASKSTSKFNIGVEYGTLGTTSNNLVKENFLTIQVGFSLTPYFINPWFVQRRYD